MTEEAKALLASIDGPLCVVASLCGVASQAGLLRQALQPPEDAGGDAQAVEPTNCLGMYLWPEPLVSRSSDGTEVNMVVLEVEGLGNEDGLGGRDDRMFALSALLSSFMIYTTTGALSDEAVDKLWARCAFLVDSVRVNGEDQEHAEELSDSMPKLLWLLHNFSLQRAAVEVVADRTPSPQVAQSRATPGGTPRQYLEKALEDMGGLSSRATTSCRGKKKARASLRRLFLDRDCFPLSTAGPSPDDSRASAFATPDSAGSMGSFGARLPSRKQLLVLRDRVLNNAEVKSVFGAELSGRMLASLADAYVNVFNAAVQPCISDVWTIVCDGEFERHQAESLESYDFAAAELRARMPLGSSELSQWHMSEARRSHQYFGELTAALQQRRKHRQVSGRTPPHTRVSSPRR